MKRGMSEEAMEALKDVLKMRGIRFEQHSDYCKGFLSSHPNCVGCESEEGCRRMALCNVVFHIAVTESMELFVTKRDSEGAVEIMRKSAHTCMEIIEADSVEVEGMELNDNNQKEEDNQ